MSSEGRSPLILTALEGIPLIRQGNDLAEILLQVLKQSNIDLIDGDGIDHSYVAAEGDQDFVLLLP